MAETKSTFAVKVGLAQMLKGGVIMDVVNEEQARIAEEAGAVAGARPPACCAALRAAACPPGASPPARRFAAVVPCAAAFASRTAVPRARRGT